MEFVQLIIKCSVVLRLNKCLTSCIDIFINECSWLFQIKFVSHIRRRRHSENLLWSFVLSIFFHINVFANTMRNVKKNEPVFALHGNKMPQLL